MATYTLISSTTLTGLQATITFSAIPSTYTDLVLRVSARAENSGTNGLTLNLRLNNDFSALYSFRLLRGNSSVANSAATSAETNLRLQAGANTDLSTTNTFSSLETYIPSYTVSQSKPISSFWVQENNSSTASESFIMAQAGLYRSNTAISELSLTNDSGYRFLSGSSFYLYGISNA
jgi:hypothetical protein